MVRRSVPCVVVLLSFLIASAIVLENSASASGWQTAAGNETPAARNQRKGLLGSVALIPVVHVTPRASANWRSLPSRAVSFGSIIYS